MHFENTGYRVLQEKSNNTTSFAEQLKFQEKVTFTHVTQMSKDKSTLKKLKLGHYTF